MYQQAGHAIGSSPLDSCLWVFLLLAKQRERWTISTHPTTNNLVGVCKCYWTEYVKEIYGWYYKVNFRSQWVTRKRSYSFHSMTCRQTWLLLTWPAIICVCVMLRDFQLEAKYLLSQVSNDVGVLRNMVWHTELIWFDLKRQSKLISFSTNQ